MGWWQAFHTRGAALIGHWVGSVIGSAFIGAWVGEGSWDQVRYRPGWCCRGLLGLSLIHI
eukprot:12357453-Prorocentrum_lima.AAC.1